MKLLAFALFACAVVGFSSSARAAAADTAVNAGGNGNGPRTADEEWSSILVLSTPRVTANPGQGRRTQALADAEARQRAEQAREASTKAKDFYLQNPTHVNAGEAKKLEALMALQGVLDSDPAQETSARAVAASYRSNSNSSAADRFEVAVLAERVAARTRLGGTPFGNNPAELEIIADRLFAEFGELPEAYNFYASVIRSADMTRAGRMAERLLRAPGAPVSAKSDAQSIRAKLDLLGSAFPTQLRSTNARTIDLAQQTGKLTILYVWAAQVEINGMEPLRAVKRSLPNDAEVIYLPLGISATQVQALESRRPVPGPICVDLGTSPGALAELCRSRHLPYVYLLDRAAKLRSFGPASELSALIAEAGR